MPLVPVPVPMCAAWEHKQSPFFDIVLVVVVVVCRERTFLSAHRANISIIICANNVVVVVVVAAKSIDAHATRLQAVCVDTEFVL